MGFHLLSLGALLLLLTRVFESQALPFDKNYNISWGNNNVKSLNKGEEIQLSLDKNSGDFFFVVFFWFFTHFIRETGVRSVYTIS